MRRDLQERPEMLTRTNWKSWKNEIEKHARKEGVWKYCNPDAPSEYYPELHEPEKPHVSTVRPEAKSIVDLGEDDFIELSSIVDQYWKQMRAYENIQTKLQVIFELIENNVDYEHFSLIKHAETPLEQMAVLAAKSRNLAWRICSQDGKDAFWDCVETAGDPLENWLPLTSQHWIETPDYVESRSYGDGCAQPRSPTEQESVTSLDWIETPDDLQPRNYKDDCAQLRSRARRGSIASRYRNGYYDPVVSTGRTSLSPQSGFAAGQSDHIEEISGDDLEMAGLPQRSRLSRAKEGEN
ncbi:hypothetical protein N7519_006076 [Penicillium mononematosum]|uniref:uncharacterized protein n=1 Tax=Penicillium mononematosum TaxID=268346 RepID=UPI002547ACA9|nr:uncharacterized protein N7519_006076 [Penicillium mononematosum]KAJ6184775.1 hypothetical protein N7519_006076 [Penicillium mononematosum]